MLSDVMTHFSLGREFDRVDFFSTEAHDYLIKEMATTIIKGRIIALTGIVGCGKTRLLLQLRQQLKADNAVVVARSLAVDKARVTLPVLMRALAYDLATDEQMAKLPRQPEDREHHIVDIIAKRKKPACLFVDDSHELHGNTLIRLKRLIEAVWDEGQTLSIVLAGHPKLKADLRCPTLEEIGARTEIFDFEGIQGHQREYLDWLLKQAIKGKTKPDSIIDEEAIALLAERLVTPLQIGHYLALAFTEAYSIGQKPVTADVVNNVLAASLNEPEPHLIRHGYNVKSLAQLLNVKPAEIRSFLHGQLQDSQHKKLKDELLKCGVPL